MGRSGVGDGDALVYERNPGFLGFDPLSGRRQFVDFQDEEGVWRSAAYWARKDRGIRLRSAQIACGDGAWTDDGFLVRSSVGAPWIADLAGKHGRYSTYVNWECRCGPCKMAHEEYGSDYRAGLTGASDGRR